MSNEAVISEKKHLDFKERKFFGMSDKIKAVAKVMAEKDGIVINMGAANASTDGKTINLPYVNPELTISEVDCHIGYINHEAGHVIHSNFKTLKTDLSLLSLQFNKVPLNLIHYIYNSAEDVRIEVERAKTNPGCPMYINTMNKSILDELYKKQKKEKQDNRPESAVSSAILFNTYCYAGANNNHPYWDMVKPNPNYEPLVSRLFPVYKYIMSNSKNQSVTLSATREIIKRIAEYIEEAKKDPPKNNTTPPPEQQQPNLGSSPKANSDPSEEKKDTQQPSKESQSNQSSQKDPEPTTNPSSNATSQSSSPSQGCGNQPETNPISDPSFKINDKQTEILKEVYNIARANDDIAISKDGGHISKADKIKNDLINSNSLDIKPLDKSDIDKSIETRLQRKTAVLQETLDKGREASMGMRKAFVKSMRSFKNKNTKRNQREGVLDSRSISRYILSKKTDIFKSTKKFRKLNTALHITLDASYSMGDGNRLGSLAEIARRTIIAINKAVKGLNIKLSISLFNTNYAIIKNITAPFSNTQLESLTGGGGTDLAKAIISSGYYLYGATQPRKILICVTDGEVNKQVVPTDKLVSGSGIEIYYIILGSGRPDNIPKERYILLNSSNFSKNFLDSLQSLLLTGKFNNV